MEYTSNLNLYKWNKTDSKIATIDAMSQSMTNIDDWSLTVGTAANFKGVGNSIVEKMTNEFTGRGINPEWFGLSASATDNYQAMIDSLNHIKNVLGGKGKIVLPQGKVFKFLKPLGSHTVSNIMIDLNGSTLDFSGVPATNTDSWLQFTGTIATEKTVSNSTLAEGSTAVGVNTSGLAVGDMVKLYSNKIWDSTRTSTRIGEICFIKSIENSTNLTLTTPTQDTYLYNDSTKLAKITPVENVVVMNGKVIGPAGDNELRGLRITRGLNCLIQNITSIGFDVNHMQLTDCVRSVVHSCYFQEANHSSMAYGVSFADASQDCICSNSHFTDVRHSLSTNNNVSTSWGITRRILFIGNTVTDSSPSLGGTGGDAIDTHAGAEDIYIINNIVYSSSGLGINAECHKAIISGNRIKSTGSAGINFSSYADGKLSAVNISDNQITNVGDAVGTDYGISVYVRVGDCESIIISDNTIDSQNGSIVLSPVNGYKFRKGSISGNSCKVRVSGYGIDVKGSNLIAVGSNSIETLYFGIGFTDCSNCSATGNTVELKGTTGNAHGVRFTGTTKRSAGVGNTVLHTGTATAYGVSCADTATYNMLSSNVSENCTYPAAAGAGTGNVAVNNI